MEEPNVYEIKNLLCGYKSDHPVLFIKDLTIERSTLYFIVGPSGIGKSTFIEALGLMNNTILGGTNSTFKYTNKVGNIHDLSLVWKDSLHTIDKFRKNYFSFLFQNNFLMPNFTSGENMMFTALLKGDSIDYVERNILELMAKVDLSNDLFTREVSQLSGGQKQRVAFIRSLVASCEVLFADEPTGNLDQITARKILKLMKEENLQRSRTAMIVSHDLDMAIEFADVIVPIVKSASKGTMSGIIDHCYNFRKKDDFWVDHENNRLFDIKSLLIQMYQEEVL